MTDQDLQRRVAEKCGWTETIEFIHRGRREQRANPIPPYTTSIDAIRAAVLEQGEEFQGKFAEQMFQQCSGQKGCDHFHQLTARDWSICFLEAWEKVQK
jgi:hypothetical protein